MRLNEVTYKYVLPVESYGPGFLRVYGAVIEGGVAIMPTGVTWWSGYGVSAEFVAAAGNVDVLLVGTGAEMAQVPADFRSQIEAAGIGLEMMASPQACRTYNVLLGEGRRVALAALPVGRLALLEVTDLHCSRGGLPVLAGVSFSLQKGAALVLRGPNGSGKTTLLRTIAGLQPPAAGSIEAAPDSIAYAAHADGVKGTLTVAENLEFWSALFGTNEIDAAVDAFDLAGLRDRMAGRLSAGQKRRLGLARLLVAGRPVWALDEPTVSLDAASVGLFAAAVQAHLAKGGAALIATHIDLGVDAETLDLSAFRATESVATVFDEAFS